MTVGFGAVKQEAKASGLTPTQSVYTWNQGVTGDWQSPASWTPARTTPASSDILRFSHGGTTTPTNLPTESLGQLIIFGNTTVNLQSATAVTLTIAGADGDDLIVEGASALNFNGPNALTVNLASGATAALAGSITFSSSSTTAHRLMASDAGAIIFSDGSVFTAGSGLTGNPFGTTNLNSVIFESGSVYICSAGDNPFGATEPASVVVFKKGSLFSLRGNANTAFFSGRTYANFELNFPGGDPFAEGTSALVMDDLTLTAGQLHLWMTGNPGHSIKGNIATLPGTRLDMQGNFQGQTINLNGDGPQTIAVLGNIGINPANTVAIDNSAGVTVTTAFAVWNLELVNGIVSVTNDLGLFHVSGSVSRLNGHIRGNLRRTIDSTGSFRFDVGTENGYSPVTVEVTAGHSFFAIAQVRAIQSAEPHVLDPSRALSRYWQITGSPNITGANIIFNYLDPTDIPATATESNFLIQRYSTGFTQPAGVIDTQTNAFRVTGLTDLSTANWTLAESRAVQPPTAALFDYDGDGRTDMSVFRPASGVWYLNRSTDGFKGLQFGVDGDRLAPADYDGDGKTDIAVYRPSDGRWYILNSATNTVTYPVFGAAEDLPAPGDHDGDGKADLNVFRPSQGTWYRQNSSNGSFFGMQFGAMGDVPTVGDFDGDGKNDLGIWRPSNGDWYNIRSSNGSVFGERFGQTGDKIAPADYDGDGKTDIAIFRPSTGLWVVRNSATATYSYHVFGAPSDVPISGDYDGDGKADIGVWRPSDGTWYIQRSDNGQFIVFPWGQNGDRPTPAAFGN